MQPHHEFERANLRRSSRRKTSEYSKDSESQASALFSSDPTDQPQNAHVFTRETAERIASEIRSYEEEVHRIWTGMGQSYEMKLVSVIPCATGKFIHTFV